MGPLLRSPAECARQAIENDVHAVGIGAPSGQASPVPALVAELQAQGADDIVVFTVDATASHDDDAPHFASAQDVLQQIRKATST